VGVDRRPHALLDGNEPMSHAPCTLFWPRSGFTPTPGRPRLPVTIARFAMPMTMVEPRLCSVTPSDEEESQVMSTRDSPSW